VRAARCPLPVTTGTLTSVALAASRLDRDDVHQFVPLSPRFVARFLDHRKPDPAIFTESEIWPNSDRGCRRPGGPAGALNARMSARSYSRWMKQRAVSRPPFNRLVVLIQTEKLSRWFRDLGARQAIAAGNLKVDAPPPPVDAAALAGLQAAHGDRPRLIVASTQGAEEGR
jgi:3-deoxy-D-manno-octulosonic-acid transferase